MSFKGYRLQVQKLEAWRHTKIFFRTAVLNISESHVWLATKAALDSVWSVCGSCSRSSRYGYISGITITKPELPHSTYKNTIWL